MREKFTGPQGLEPPAGGSSAIKISAAAEFLLNVPRAREMVGAATDKLRDEMRGKGSLVALVSAQWQIFDALRSKDPIKLKEVASDSKSPGHRLLMATYQPEPLLNELLMTPAEQTYRSIRAIFREEFVQKRSFLKEVLFKNPEGEILDYLNKFIDQMEFFSPLMASLENQKRREILLVIFRNHLIKGASFSQIRQELSEPPFFDQRPDGLPADVVLAKYCGVLVYGLAAKWPEISQKYDLTHRKDVVACGQEVITRLDREDKRKKRFEQILNSPEVPLLLKVAIQAFSSETPTRLDRFLERTPYFKKHFTQVIDKRIEVNPEYTPTALEVVRILDFFYFSENVWAVLDHLNGQLFYKRPHQIFLEIAQEAQNLSPAKYDCKLRLQAFKGLVRYVGLKGIREFLASLPGKTEEEKVKMVGKLRGEAHSELELKETTIGVYAREIAAVICDIMDGPSVWGPEMMDRGKLLELVFKKRGKAAA